MLENKNYKWNTVVAKSNFKQINVPNGLNNVVSLVVSLVLI